MSIGLIIESGSIGRRETRLKKTIDLKRHLGDEAILVAQKW